MPSTKHAVVAGATSGIGEAIARNLAVAGMRVTLVGRNDEAVTTAPHTTDHTTDPVRCDRLWDESARLVGEPATL